MKNERRERGKFCDVPSHVHLYMYIFILRMGYKCYVGPGSVLHGFPRARDFHHDAKGEHDERVCRGRRILFLARSYAEGDGEWRRRQGARRMRAACIRGVRHGRDFGISNDGDFIREDESFALPRY